MDTHGSRGADAPTCSKLGRARELLAREILAHMTDKWSIWVIQSLGCDARLRFSELLRRVEGVSPKMLTKTLRGLERDGLVSRTVHPEVPPRVEYELSAVGRDLLDRVAPLWLWVAEGVDRFQALRDAHDARPRRPAAAVDRSGRPDYPPPP